MKTTADEALRKLLIQRYRSMPNDRSPGAYYGIIQVYRPEEDLGPMRRKLLALLQARAASLEPKE